MPTWFYHKLMYNFLKSYHFFSLDTTVSWGGSLILVDLKFGKQRMVLVKGLGFNLFLCWVRAFSLV